MSTDLIAIELGRTVKHGGADAVKAAAELARLAVEEDRERRGLALKYCKTHRTIVPVFKDGPFSCCQVAEERKRADEAIASYHAAYGDGYDKGKADERERCLEEAAVKLKAECIHCNGTGKIEVVGKAEREGEVWDEDCPICEEAMRVVRSLKAPEQPGTPEQTEDQS